MYPGGCVTLMVPPPYERDDRWHCGSAPPAPNTPLLLETAVAPAARGVAGQTPGDAAPRHLPPRRALRPGRVRRGGDQGAGRAPGGTRVRTAVQPCPARHNRGGPTRRGHRAHRRRRGTAGADADHPSPQRVPALPLDVRDDHAPERGAPAHGRARRTARPIPPFRGSMDQAELCHELLEHLWCMSERAQGDIGPRATVADYVATALLRPGTEAPPASGCPSPE